MRPRSTSGTPEEAKPLSQAEKVKRLLIGQPRDLTDRRMFRHISVIAFLAWVGLGADGLSSSAYGPEEAFRTLREHTYLAIPIALLTILTVWIISACYSRIIERFPHGGGGYVVSTALLGPRAGLASGAALLVDYVLTITVSIAAAGDAIFSFTPAAWAEYRLWAEAAAIGLLVVANIRGVKEPILALLPVFLLFILTHAILLGAGLVLQGGNVSQVATTARDGFHSGLSSLGLGGMLLLFLHAYSLGGGTYTGIEAVSNGLPIMREPRVRTARHTMVYMATSLSLTAAGLIICYLLWDVRFEPGRTLNATLAQRVTAGWPLASELVMVTLVAEGALLVVAAQAGFIDGPRVLANMAIDSWVPRRLAAMSDRLTTANGIVLMGAAALLALLYTRGDVRHLVVMYSINVFLTFSLSMLAMFCMLLRRRKSGQPWRRQITLFAVGLVLCASILAVTVFEKFHEGGWLTLSVTLLLVLLCLLVKRHYRWMQNHLEELYAGLDKLPTAPARTPTAVRPDQPVAAVLVGSYSGLGLHTLLKSLREFPGQFSGFVFIGAGIIDSGAFKGEETVDLLRAKTEQDLRKYVQFAEAHGMPAAYRMAIGTDAVDELERLCLTVAAEFPRVTFFAGQLIFRNERWYHRLLHNGTAYLLQRRLQVDDRALVILPVRI